ncbi:hypothetical protein VTJ83DRAFT_5063 [Remersonia thermophila]|uniref:Peptidase A1 domain-containing protein n=1 Tax=Remersonia thermophila TaxID=72144 RepID=A0ABR4DD82_9PEZI
MRLPCPGTAAAVAVRDALLLLFFTARLVAAIADPAATDSESPAATPLWIQPSGEWYGIDGTWSHFSFFVGSPAQIVYLTVATVLSEIWVVSSGGCTPVQLCIDARGGVFNHKVSQSWRSLGTWQLGMNYTGMQGNGDYGLESIAFVNTVIRHTTAVQGALVAAINDTNYYQGFIGVGVTPGKFGSNVTNPFISQLVETYGTIPSHSFGYTAGAYYRNDGQKKGTVASLTLGGYDTLRFQPHDIKFALEPVTHAPQVRLRGVTAHVPSMDQAPTKNWTSASHQLVTMDDSIIAVIDTSTPFLWLPTDVCERFAAALNPTWREDLALYVFNDGAQYASWLNGTSLSFTFSVSSYENADNFGQPLSAPGVVNITFPSAAFAQLLRYPFRNVIKFYDSSVPYFPLRRSTPEVNGNQYIIGRAFMQEAYMITSYDRSTFSLHQARFPDNAGKNYSLEAITRPPNSPYRGYHADPEDSAGGGGLNAGQKTGTIIGAFIVGSIAALVVWFFLIRKRKSKSAVEAGQEEENKDHSQVGMAEKVEVEEDGEPRSPVKRMFTKMIRRKRSRKPAANEMEPRDGAVEVAADRDQQIFELDVPLEPVELDSRDLGDDDDTDIVLEAGQDLTQYEITQRKLHRKMQGPVPSYTPSDTPLPGAGQEKSAQDVSPVPHYRPSDDPSPASSPTYANSSSIPGTLPSPMTPHGDWTRGFDLPSPMAVMPPSQYLQAPSHGSGSNPNSPVSPLPPISPQSPHSAHLPHTYAPSSLTNSGSSGSPTSLRPSMTLPLPSPSVQRTPIDSSRVVCLGPLPDNLQFPRARRSVPRIVAPAPAPSSPADEGQVYLQAQNLPLPRSPRRQRSPTQGSTSTLGSNYTVEETILLQTEGAPVQPTAVAGDEGNRSPVSPISPVSPVSPVSFFPPSVTVGGDEQGRSPVQLSVAVGGQDNGESRDGDMPRTPRSMERIEAGSELIHVPQVAEKRYSWEDDPRGNI